MVRLSSVHLYEWKRAMGVLQVLIQCDPMSFPPPRSEPLVIVTRLLGTEESRFVFAIPCPGTALSHHWETTGARLYTQQLALFSS